LDADDGRRSISFADRERYVAMTATAMSHASDLGFTYRSRSGGEVEIFHRGRLACRLRGAKAQGFLFKVETCTLAQAQQLMARLTGNFKRGNERLSGGHHRNLAGKRDHR
jgi:hypothetical protein